VSSHLTMSSYAELAEKDFTSTSETDECHSSHPRKV